MFARFSSMFSFFNTQAIDINNAVNYENFKSRLYEVLNARYKGDNGNLAFDVNLEALRELLKEAKSNNYNLNSHNKNGYSFVNQVIIRNTPQTEEHCIAILELLYKNGADLNLISQDSRRNAPLISATRRGMSKTVEWLLSHGADPFIKDQVNGRDNKTAYEYVTDALRYHEAADQNDIISRLQQIQNLLMVHDPYMKLHLN